jgi:hypothetical protein
MPDSETLKQVKGSFGWVCAMAIAFFLMICAGIWIASASQHIYPGYVAVGSGLLGQLLVVVLFDRYYRALIKIAEDCRKTELAKVVHQALDQMKEIGGEDSSKMKLVEYLAKEIMACLVGHC